jgi:hypothetical protein
VLLRQPLFFLALAVALVFLFALVNGISVGVSDSNPISSAFVVAVVVMAMLGLADAGAGLMAGRHPAGVDQRRLRHAAGPLHRLAARHAARPAVPLPGARHPGGAVLAGGVRTAVHGGRTPCWRWTRR